MIRILGAKRVIVLAVLIALNGLMFSGYYLFMIPEQSAKKRELAELRGKVSTLQSDIERMQVEFDQLEDQQAEFDQLKAKGFFGSQGRREAELTFEKIQNQAKVISAVVSIQRGTVEENEEAQKAEHSILVSPIKITIQALEDVDVFRYIYLVERFFPGHVTFKSVNIKRKADITGVVLRSISGGKKPELVEANIELLWRSMIPESEVITEEKG